MTLFSEGPLRSERGGRELKENWDYSRKGVNGDTYSTRDLGETHAGNGWAVRIKRAPSCVEYLRGRERELLGKRKGTHVSRATFFDKDDDLPIPRYVNDGGEYTLLLSCPFKGNLSPKTPQYNC